jgi:hypothetical protein
MHYPCGPLLLSPKSSASLLFNPLLSTELKLLLYFLLIFFLSNGPLHFTKLKLHCPPPKKSLFEILISYQKNTAPHKIMGFKLLTCCFTQSLALHTRMCNHISNTKLASVLQFPISTSSLPSLVSSLRSSFETHNLISLYLSFFRPAPSWLLSSLSLSLSLSLLPPAENQIYNKQLE